MRNINYIIMSIAEEDRKKLKNIRSEKLYCKVNIRPINYGP